MYFRGDLPTFTFVEIYDAVCYVLAGGFVILERDRLVHYNLTRFSLLLFTVGPIASLLVQDATGWPLGNHPIHWPQPGIFVYIQAVLGLIFLIAFIAPHAAKIGDSTGRDKLVCIVVGTLTGIGIGLLWMRVIRLSEPLTVLDFSLPVPGSAAASMFLVQLAGPAINEEPMFRAILWGYLRDRGLSEKNIWLVQAGLFWLVHVSHLESSVTAFFLVLVGGLLFGWLTWRSRSIAPSMLAHALINATVQLASHYKFI